MRGLRELRDAVADYRVGAEAHHWMGAQALVELNHPAHSRRLLPALE